MEEGEAPCFCAVELSSPRCGCTMAVAGSGGGGVAAMAGRIKAKGHLWAELDGAFCPTCSGRCGPQA